MIEQYVGVVIDALSMLSTLRNAMSNCRVRLGDDFGIITGTSERVIELSQIRITEVPVIEASLALRRALAAAKVHVAGTVFEEAISRCEAIHEPTIKLRLLEIALRGNALYNKDLTLYARGCKSKHDAFMWEHMKISPENVAAEVAEIRQNKQFPYPYELAVLENTLRKVLAEYKERDLPLKTYRCAYNGGDTRWLPVVVQAKDQYKARVLAIAGWMGVTPDEVGIQDEMVMRYTSMTEVPEAQATDTV